MKAPGEQTGHGNALSIPAPLGLRHCDGQPVTGEDAARKVAELADRNAARSKALRSLEAQGRRCDPFEDAALTQEAQLDAFRVRVWTGLESLASAGVSL